MPFGSLDPPSRFAEAHFDTYRAASGEQREALRAARTFTEHVAERPSVAERLRAWLPGATRGAPRGLYLVGPAGTGKTHLMAAAFHRLAARGVRCAFLHSGTFFRTAAAPEQLAEALADRRSCRALLLDEVELDDAANEARLAHFLSALAERGVALMATSNARPNEFSRHVSGGGAHRRFLTDALAGRCETVLVRGADRRRENGHARRGAIFVGPPAEAKDALRRVQGDASGATRRLTFDDLRRASTETAHARLMDALLETDHLFVTGVQITGTDDALRLLRLCIDDLYTADDAPALYFSAAAPPEEWFSTGGHAGGLRDGVAEKFDRTVSRLRELCAVRFMDDGRRTGDDGRLPRRDIAER